MPDKATTKIPEVELATKEYVLMELKDTENRIEKAFHDQVVYLNKRFEETDRRHEVHMRWLIGIGIAIIVAVLIQPILN